MSVRIGLGISEFPFADTKAFWHWVDLCETTQIDSLWQTDRLISTQPFMESMSMMAALAGHTERLKFGMNVVVLPFRDPLVLAKECATIDFLSNGRLLPAFGVGGDAAPEWQATGRQSKGRGALADEALDLMVRLWTEERVTHCGDHFQYVDAAVQPKPVQNPLPLWIGGSSPAAIRRTVRIGTGWLGGLQSPADVTPIIAAIRDQSAAAGRPIDSDHYGAAFAYRLGAWDDAPVERLVSAFAKRPGVADPRSLIAVGDADAIIERINEFRAAGVSKFVLRPIADHDADLYDQTQRLVDTVLPIVHGAPI